MASDHHVLSDDVHRELVEKVTKFSIIAGLIAALSGLLINLVGVFHLARVAILMWSVLFLLVSLWQITKNKLHSALSILMVGTLVTFSTSTLFVSGVLGPNYSGFMVLIVLVSAFTSHTRPLLIIYGLFILVGALSFLPTLNQYQNITLPTPQRVWFLYTIYGTTTLSVLLLIRKAYAKAISDLASRESLLSSIFLSITEPLIVCDLQGKPLKMNSSAEVLDAQLRDELQVGLFEASLLNLSTHTLTSLTELTAVALDEAQSYQVKLMRGREAWFAVQLSPHLLEGKRLGVVVFLRDVTHQHHLAQSQKLGAVGVLANGIAHDFNNMLGAIRNGAELLSLDLEDEEQLEMIDMITEAAQRSSELVNQLRQFSKIRPSVQAPILIESMLKDTLKQLQESATSQQRLTLELEVDQLELKGDEAQLRSALMSLGLNALQATQAERGLVQLHAYITTLDEHSCKRNTYKVRPGRFVCFEVSDNGEGMKAELKERIFEPFFTTRAVGQGTGLGLSTVHGAVEAHGGMVEVESTWGEGSTFRVYLPLTPTTTSSFNKLATPASDQKLTLKRALIIDDEPLVRKSLQKMLATLGVEATCAEGGDEGLALLKGGLDVEVVILDMQMPHKSGREVFYELKAAWPHLPVILSSGYSPEGVLEELLERGLRGVLPKPYTPEELKQALCKVGGI
jgi:signal transduction histidine kinase